MTVPPREEVLARMDNQWSDEQRISLADYSIENIDWEKTKSPLEHCRKTSSTLE